MIDVMFQVLSTYNQLIPNFQSFLNHLPPQSAQKIRDTYYPL